MRLSVVIPTLGRSPALPRTLRRLREQRDPPAFEVILVVDALGDVPEEAPGARVLLARRPGASAARNVGIREARAPVVLLMGDDILAAPTLLAEHDLWHARLPRPEGAVLGHVRWAHRPSAFERWLEHGVQTSYASIQGSSAGWGHFYTTNVSVKKAMLERVGGFDEDLPFLYEDLDLGRRLHEAGLDLRYVPHAIGEHDHPATLEGWRERMEAVGRAERDFCAKHPDVEPYFGERLRRAGAGPPARGRGARLARWIRPATPVLGPRVWASAEAFFGQQLWPAYERGWASSEGSPPGGPK
jgi:GT2 family glycosyltransferase